jgi:hypothetical protein
MCSGRLRQTILRTADRVIQICRMMSLKHQRRYIIDSMEFPICIRLRTKVQNWKKLLLRLKPATTLKTRMFILTTQRVARQFETRNGFKIFVLVRSRVNEKKTSRQSPGRFKPNPSNQHILPEVVGKESPILKPVHITECQCGWFKIAFTLNGKISFCHSDVLTGIIS